MSPPDAVAPSSLAAKPDTGRYRLLHAMLNVRDIERSIRFYTEVMGFSVLRRWKNEETRATLAFLGYAHDPSGMQLELVERWDRTEPYTVGDGYGHIGILVPDMQAAFAYYRSLGVTIAREPVRNVSALLGFIEDPDGYPIELIQFLEKTPDFMVAQTKA
jgi:lactoylglutathione lyase